MKIENDLKLDFNQVLIRPKRSTLNSRSGVNLERTFKFKWSTLSWTGIPVIASNMDCVGTFEVYDVLSKHKMITAFHKFYKIEDYKTFKETRDVDPNFFAISTGIGKEELKKLEDIMNVIDFNIICIDVANGYISTLVDFCKTVREKFPDKIIIAGNVVTREIVEELILNGKVDIVKVGIGPGSACTTRMKTGVGMPQLSAIIECSDAAHGVAGHIIGDGGITCPGDMSKAFGGGADFVMVGGVFAGHDENPGEITEVGGKYYKKFYGMSSKHAMEKHYGSMNDYRSSEGRCVEIPLKGKLNDTILDYLGGVRSTCTYINAPTIKEIPKCTTFVYVAQQLNHMFVS
tara:strand:+ start:4719 stop:5756 length:1038 start_codon:yes stop_codon:yes gene_type:complete